MNEFCAREITPRASKAYVREKRISSELRLPITWSTTCGKCGSPVRNPGKTTTAPNKSAAPFNHAKRRSSDECSGNTAKKREKSGHSISEDTARKANATARRGRAR